MTVGELKAELAKYSDDALIVLSKDSEGNRFSPLSDVEDAFYVANTTWEGDIYYSEETVEEMGITAEAAVVLWPVN